MVYGPAAVRKFSVMARDPGANANRPVEGDNVMAQLPQNFGELSPRDQYLERRRLFHRLCRDYSQLRRPYLKAMEAMSVVSFKFRAFGPVPGIQIGDIFHYKAEMYMVGLHMEMEAGIASARLGDERAACSIVVTSRYRDNVYDGDVILYSRHGSNDKDRVGDKEAQKLTARNQALKHSFKYKVPVRVIQGIKNRRNDGEILGLQREQIPYKTYSYNGLYIVESLDSLDFKKGTTSLKKKGTTSLKVHKFTLRRVPGQPPLAMINVV